MSAKQVSARLYSGYLILRESVTIAPTKGSVNLAGATDIFTRYLGPETERLSNNNTDSDTDTQVVNVHQMVTKDTFARILNLVGELSSLCLTQGQIVEFSSSHRNCLCQNGWPTYFLLMARGEIFIVDVHVRKGLLEVGAVRFRDVHIWMMSRVCFIVTRKLTSRVRV